MGLDAIALKDDTESAKQGLSKLVSFINPDTETSEQNRLWAQENVLTNDILQNRKLLTGVWFPL